MKKKILHIFLLLQVTHILGCKPTNLLFDEIKNAQFIPYNIPLEYSGAGTIIGNKPSAMQLLAPPHECFPEVNEDGTTNDLVFTDNSALPSTHYEMKVDADAKVELFKIMAVGNPTINLGAGTNNSWGIELVLDGVHANYFNLVKLKKFYLEKMSNECKDLLDYFGFITESLQVEQMKFRFFQKSGAYIKINVNNIENFVNLDAGIKYSIDKETTLVIKTPKYIGYRVGRLMRQDAGFPLYQAHAVANDKYQFKKIAQFDPNNKSNSQIPNSHVIGPQEVKNFLKLNAQYSIDRFSEFQN